MCSTCLEAIVVLMGTPAAVESDWYCETCGRQQFNKYADPVPTASAPTGGFVVDLSGLAPVALVLAVAAVAITAVCVVWK